MKPHPTPRRRRTSPGGGSSRALQKCVRELRALYAEASGLLEALLLNPAAEILWDLCARFQIVQEYFAMRYRQARTHAVSALGHVEALRLFP